MMEQSLQKLNEIYNDPRLGFLSETKLYAKAKALGLNLSHKDIKAFLAPQEVNQVFKVRRIKHYFPLQSQVPFQRGQIDLLDLSNETIRGYKWIFCYIDVYTRLAICYPMKSKSEKDCLFVFAKILSDIQEINGFTPDQIDSDKESAFQSKAFMKLCADYGITQNMGDSTNFRAKGIVERFNRTLRSIIAKYKTASHKLDWVTVLPDLVFNYNNTLHTTLKTTPQMAITNNDKYDDMKIAQTKRAEGQSFNSANIKIGDKVRLKIKKAIFDKEGVQFTKTVHIVEAIEGGLYSVSDRAHKYKKYELQLVPNVHQNIPRLAEDMVADERVIDQEKHERRVVRRNKKAGVDIRDINPLGIDRRPPRVPKPNRNADFEY